jgi:dienelactone hydrolase
MLTESMDWVTKGDNAAKYGTIDKTKIAAAGQSCGGIEAMTVSSDPRVKAIGMFNSGMFSASAQTAKLKVPIAYFLGGTGDIAYSNVSSYSKLSGPTC